MKSKTIIIVLFLFILLNSFILSDCRKQNKANPSGSENTTLEKPTNLHQDEWVAYVGAYEELKESEQKEKFVLWEKEGKLLLRYQTKDYELKKIELHKYLFVDNRLFDSNSVIFAAINKNRATVCKIGTYLFSRVYAPTEEIPVLSEGTVQNALKTNQDAAKNRSFQEKKLVAVTSLKPSIQPMLRLSTSINPLKQPLVVMKNPYLDAEAAKNLARVEEELQKDGLSLVVYQAYIPWYAEQSYLQLVQAMQIEQPFWVPFQKNYYSSGYTVDVGLFNQKTQQYVDMGSEYLENIDPSALDYFGGTVSQRYYKTLLSSLMKKYGFIPYDAHWWGYTFQTKGTILPSNQDVQEESTKK